MNQRRQKLHAELTAHALTWRSKRVDAEFARDPERHPRHSRSAAGITLDYSKQRLDSAVVALLCELADAHALRERTRDMFEGRSINVTEQRPVLHTALRARRDAHLSVDGQEVTAEIDAVKHRMRQLAHALRSGEWRGFRGDAVTDVVNLGIGGSHLGPQMACQALSDDATESVRVHFVSNVDGGEIARCLSKLEPARTVFILASKSFTTTETMRNAQTAQAWLRAAGAEEGHLAAHFIAITARPDRAGALGIAPENILPMWDWVGGRYSVWSAIGLPLAIAIGMDRFEHMLAGAEEMDRHFRTAAWPDNLPVLLALLGIWNSNFLGAETLAVVPYEDRLRYLSEYLQQLDMESNGKRVRLDNEAVDSHTAPILWGGIGTNVQHAFFQLLHQGTRLIPVDFILALTNPRSPAGHHDMLVANCLAQAEGLMNGRSAASLDGQMPAVPGIDLPTHRATPGNQPSTLLLMDSLSPHTLGALLALYEHKTFVQGVVWEINSFDQWGVELGKVLAETLLDEIGQGVSTQEHDASTAAALQRYLARRKP